MLSKEWAGVGAVFGAIVALFVITGGDETTNPSLKDTLQNITFEVGKCQAVVTAKWAYAVADNHGFEITKDIPEFRFEENFGGVNLWGVLKRSLREPVQKARAEIEKTKPEILKDYASLKLFLSATCLDENKIKHPLTIEVMVPVDEDKPVVVNWTFRGSRSPGVPIPQRKLLR